MPNMAPAQPAAPKKGGAGKTVAIVVVLLVIIGLVAYFLMSSGGGKPGPMGGNQPQAGDQPGQPAGDGTGPDGQPARPPAPDEIFSYVGTVKSVGNGQITVTVKPETNYVDQETTLTVRADASTQVIRRTIPKVLPEDGNLEGLFKQENISLSDVKAGDEVTVVSSANIKGKTDFTASRIEVLNVK